MILHIDMDAFFASVEQLDNPELRGKPVIIGVESARGVVSTASYEARKFGVHSAMPVFQAKKLCPEGIFVRGRMKRYKEISMQVFGLLHDFSPVVEPVSIDEAYIDISGCERILGSPEVIAANIKRRISEDIKLSCSIGVSPLKFLSKIASDMNKPDGLTIIYPGDLRAVIENMSVKKVPGVGKTTYQHLEVLGVRTLGDIRKIPENTLKSRIGIFGKRLKELSEGIDKSIVSPGSERKSISTETTLSKDTWDVNLLKKYLLKQSDEVARQLRLKKVKAKTVTLKITFSDFKQMTRRTSLDRPTQSSKVLYEQAIKLFDKEFKPNKIRLIGVGGSGLFPESHPEQAMLFEKKGGKESESWEKAEKVMDSILGKFGNNSVTRAALKKNGDKG